MAAAPSLKLYRTPLQNCHTWPLKLPVSLHLGRPPMNFDLIRLGLPNTAALVALAIMPIVALTMPTDPRPAAGQIEQAEPATICQAPVACAETVIAAAAPEFVAD